MLLHSISRTRCGILAHLTSVERPTPISGDELKFDSLHESITTSESVDSSNRYRFLADAMPQIVWTAKPDGNLDYYNKRWFDYTGMTIEQTKDWGWKHVVHPDDLQNCVERWTKTFMTGCDYEVEYRFKRALDLCFGRFVVVPYLVCTGGGCRLQFVKCHLSGCRISGSLTKPWHLPAAPDFDEQPIKDR